MGDVPTLRGTEPATMSSGMSPGDALALRAANCGNHTGNKVREHKKQRCVMCPPSGVQSPL